MKSSSTARLAALFLLLLTGCSSQTHLPAFTASGYLADRGVVRIWRKGNQQNLTHMVTVFTPFNGSAAEKTDYQWQDGRLTTVERHIAGQQPEDVMLRFGREGAVSFMQRQLAGRREALSADEIALYQFDAQRMVGISDDLLTGQVRLRQGRRSADGTVVDCQQARLHPVFDAPEVDQLRQWQKLLSGPPSIAWLEAPGGTQLLLVSRANLCDNQPKASEF